MNRRNFMGSAIAGAGMISGLEALANSGLPSFQFENKLSLKVLGTNWGFVGTTDSFCAAIKKEGYDGTEMWWPGTKEKQAELLTALKKYDLAVGFLCGSGENDYMKHSEAFKIKSMQQQQSLVKNHYTLIVIAAEIFLPTSRIKYSLTTQQRFHLRAGFRSIMKRTAAECFLPRTLQEVLLKKILV